MIPLLRTMTRKSRLGFGKYKDLTIQHILDMKLNSVLVSAYFKLTSINYTEDILQEIGISKEYRIKKPVESLADLLFGEFLQCGRFWCLFRLDT